MGFLNILRDAIAPAAAARSGYLQGQDEERDRQRLEAIQDAELRRQGTLDQIRAAVDQSTIARNNSQANRYDAMHPAEPRDSYEVIKGDDGTQYLQNKNNPKDIQPIMMNGKPVKAPSSAAAQMTPHTINTSQGIMMWDPESKTYQPTGFDAPAPSRNGAGSGTGASAQDRLDAKTALDAAVQNLPRPSKTPAEMTNPAILNATSGTDVKKLPVRIPNPAYEKVVADSTDYDNSVVKPLRQHLIDVTVGDKVKLGGAGGAQSDSTGGLSTATPITTAPTAKADKPMLDAGQSSAMQTEFDEASSNLNAILNSGAPKAVKDQARALYNQQQTSIAQKYGAPAAGQP